MPIDRQHTVTSAGLASLLLPLQLLLIAWVQPAGALGFSQVSFDPQSYYSPSGEFTLFLNPQMRDGSGSAHYQLSANGAVLWDKEFPFTLSQPLVTDAGQIAGITYSMDQGETPESGERQPAGELSVVIINREGEISLTESHPLKSSDIEDAPPFPMVLVVMSDGLGKRLVVSVVDLADTPERYAEQWWRYDLATGDRLPPVIPQIEKPENTQLSLAAAKPLPGSPLILAHWLQHGSQDIGALFALLDDQGRAVWELSLPNDYQEVMKGVSDGSPVFRILRQGAIVSATQINRFSLILAQERSQVDFVVSQDGEGRWLVERVGEQALANNAGAQTDDSQNTLFFDPMIMPLQQEILLSQSCVAKERPTGTFRGLDFDTDGSVVTARSYPDDTFRLMRWTPKGERLQTLEFTLDKDTGSGSYAGPANIGQGRFVIARSTGWGEKASTRWFMADFNIGTITPLDRMETAAVESLAGNSDGRFAAVLRDYSEDMPVYRLAQFDSEGALLWEVESRTFTDETLVPSQLIYPAGLATLVSGEVIVVDASRNSLLIYSPTGEFQQMIDITPILQEQSAFSVMLAARSDGGFALYVPDMDKPLSFLNDHGELTERLVPHHADGRPFALKKGMKYSPNGALWGSDGSSALSLSTTGMVTTMLGGTPSATTLSLPDKVHVGQDNRIYIADRRTSTVYGFEPDGSCLPPYLPLDEDLSPSSRVNHINVTDIGEVFLTLDDTPRYLHFNAMQQRLGWTRIGPGETSYKLYSQPYGGEIWAVGDEDILLVNAELAILKQIKRHPDGRWLEDLDDVAVASDGALAVAVNSYDSGKQTVISLFTAAGEPIETLRLPIEASLKLYEKGRLYLSDDGKLLVFQDNGTPLGSLELPSRCHWKGPFLAAQGNELWFIDIKGLILRRYGLPETIVEPVSR